MIRRPRAQARAAILLCAVLACDGGTEPEPGAAVASLQLADPVPNPAFVGRALAPRVRALDADGDPVAGATLRFATTRGTTALAANVATTDAAGVAAPGAWQLPTTPTVDTLVVTVDGAAGSTAVVRLRVPMLVQAGPAASVVPLVDVTGAGVVGVSMIAGPAFRVVDAFGNPMPGARVDLRPIPVPTTVSPARALIEGDSVADANGIVRVARWTPRTLGVHELVAVVHEGPTSATLRRTVAAPACAPIAVLPEPDVVTGAAEFQAVSGALGADVTAACADTVDRYVIVADSTRVTRLAARRTGDNALLPIEVRRIGSDGAVETLAPRQAAQLTFELPPGSYEVIVGDGSANGGYTLQVTNLARGIRINSWCEPVYAPTGLDASFRGTCGPAPNRLGRTLIVPLRGRTPYEVRVGVQMENGIPTIEVFGRRDGSSSMDLLSEVTGVDGTASAAVVVPAGYQEAVVRITRPFPTSAPTPDAFDTRFSVSIE